MTVLLTRIRVVGLFNMFDHEIKIKRDEKITIITAPNGFGKTVILRLTNAFFLDRIGNTLKPGFESLSWSSRMGA